MIKRPETELESFEQESQTNIWPKTVNSELVLSNPKKAHSLTSQLVGSYILLRLGRILT